MTTILRRFPAWRTMIEQIYLVNAEFREICHDYNEVDALLAAWTAHPTDNPAIVDEYRRLREVLENELVELLVIKENLTAKCKENKHV